MPCFKHKALVEIREQSMAIEEGRLFQEFDERNIAGQARGIRGKAIDPKTQSKGLIEMINTLFHRSIDVETQEGTIRVNVRSAKKFILSHGDLFPDHRNKTSLTDEEIQDCIHKLRKKQTDSVKWEALQKEYDPDSFVYEDLGIKNLFRRGAADSQQALLTFQRTIDDQYFLLPEEKRKEINHGKLFLGDPSELTKLTEALYNEFKPGTPRGEYIARLLYKGRSFADKPEVLRRARAFRKVLETNWNKFCESDLFSWDKTLELFNQVISGKQEEVLKRFLHYYSSIIL